MSSGHGSGPEDPQGTSAPDDASSQDDQDLEWTAWRSGPGYSRPEPPEPEAGPAVPKPGSHEKPGPRHPYQDRVPNPSPPAERRDDFWGPKHSSETSSYPPPEVHEEPASREPSRPAPSAYPAPSPYEEPGSFKAVPKPRPYVSSSDYELPSRAATPAPASTDGTDPDEPGRFDEPYDNRPDDADSGPRSQDEKEEYARFWSEGRRGSGGGAHASPAGPAREPVTPIPPPPGDTSIYRNPPPRRQLGFLIAVAAVIAVAAIVATFLLTRHNPKHPAAGGSPSSGANSSHSPSPPASTPPSLSGASGHLGVPGAIGTLRLNSALTTKWVGASVKKQDANSFLIPDSDVVSGFYTASPTATSYSTHDPRLMFLAAYLSGSGNAHSALHEFMTNHSFTSQQQVSPGPKGGVAACGWLQQRHASPVAHCMWADGETYADFYSWNSSPSALAKTMIGIRAKVELSH